MCPFSRSSVPVAALVLCSLAGALAQAADDGLASLIPVHEAAVALTEKGQWAEAAARYRQFAAARPGSAEGGLAAVLGGLILLRELGKPDEALGAFAQAVKLDGGFAGRVAWIAKSWIARLRMQQLRSALHAYWVRHVEYPERLEALAEKKLVPAETLTDPWGRPFEYRTAALSIAPDLPRQRYTLRCATTGADSGDLEAALKRTAELPRMFELKAIGASRPPSALMKLKGDNSPPRHVAEGEKIGPATLIKLTRQVAVLADGDAVAVFCL